MRKADLSEQKMTISYTGTKIQIFQHLIVKYWDKYGRKDLPWRTLNDPWVILLTEIMLRKTTSEQVRELFPVFAHWSPTEILMMDFNELTEHLKPLGLSQVRAAQLKRIAEGFIDRDTNAFRSDDYLQSFAGIGRYISNSVRCCAFGEPLPALDTNMIRVIERVFGWKSTRKRAREDKNFWEFAETLVPKDRPTAYNWGVLDLGAAICTSRNPKCQVCPLKHICLYFQQQIEKGATTDRGN